MGFNSLVFICNDAMGEIDKDPAGWWVKTKHELFSLTYGEEKPYGFGNHCNGFSAVHCRHADEVELIVVGGNYTSSLLTYPWSGTRGHHEPKDQVELLRLAASRLGYSLVKASKKQRLTALKDAERDKPSTLWRSSEWVRSLDRRIEFLKSLDAETS